MIPLLVHIPPEPLLVLPVGVHTAGIGEVKSRFAWNTKRREIFGGFVQAVRYLFDRGCRRFYLGGSFVSSKDLPGDFDGCWDPLTFNISTVDPMFTDMPRRRAAQQSRYGGELYMGAHDEEGFDARPNYFQQDDRTMIRKGILVISL